jgi:uncharacterized membrane protein YkvA (DUF1232 family)
MAKFRRAFRIFRSLVDQAEPYEKDDRATGELASRGEKRAKQHRTAIGRVFDDLMTFLRLLKARAKGRYRQTPWKSVALVIGAVLYFISPLDAIPDFIPLIGFADDAAVIALVMRAVRKDVEAFRAWEGASA